MAVSTHAVWCTGLSVLLQSSALSLLPMLGFSIKNCMSSVSVNKDESQEACERDEGVVRVSRDEGKNWAGPEASW